MHHHRGATLTLSRRHPAPSATCPGPEPDRDTPGSIHDVTWTRRKDWVNREIAGRALLARPDGERRTLGGLATAVWVVLDEPGTTADVIARLNELAPDQQIEERAVVDAVEMLVDAEVVDA